MSAMTEYLRRAVGPRVVVATSRWRLRAAAYRLLKRRPRIELFFAFDDPYSAIALPGLIQIARARKAELKLVPLLERGIDGDPAADKRRLHAVTDSRRLALRDGRSLSRTAPLAAGDCAFLASWAAAAQSHEGLPAFAAAALQQLWFSSASGQPQAADFQALHVQHLGAPPAANTNGALAALAQNRKHLHKLGHWETPAAYIAGEWFFAHERLPQIDAHLRAMSE